MKSNNNLYIAAAVFWLFLSYSIFFFVSDEQIKYLAKEDGFFESAGAIFFLISAIFFMKLFLINRKDFRLYFYRNIFFLLLSCAFLFAFFEEISWGQRIFHLKTPEILEQINIQKEINLHNIEIFSAITEEGERKSGLSLFLSFSKLFALFWFSFCCLLPFLHKFHYQTKKTIDRIYFPIVPISLGGVFLINYALSKMIESNINASLLGSLIEIKEANFSYLFLIVSIWFYKHNNNASHPS